MSVARFGPDIKSVVVENDSTPIGVSNNLECAYCLRQYVYPYQLPCGHSFCRKCLEKEFDTKKDAFECVLCEAPATRAGAVVNRALWDLLRDFVDMDDDERRPAYKRMPTTLAEGEPASASPRAPPPYAPPPPYA